MNALYSDSGEGLGLEAGSKASEVRIFPCVMTSNTVYYHGNQVLRKG